MDPGLFGAIFGAFLALISVQLIPYDHGSEKSLILDMYNQLQRIILCADFKDLHVDFLGCGYSMWLGDFFYAEVGWVL